MPCREPITIDINIPGAKPRLSAYTVSTPRSMKYKSKSRQYHINAEMRESERAPLLWSAPSQSPAVAQNPPPDSQPQARFRWPSLYSDQIAADLEQASKPPLPPSALKDLAGNDAHAQFCLLTGCPPSTLGPKEKFAIPKKSLYGRVTTELRYQRRAYNFSASLNNTLLLSQVILGAALTALGAAASSHILITLFGATNTIIAGLVAYLKSRGQPMRARMYRDDLERVVDEIENSEVMWRGIADGIHGYEDIDTDEVTIRSEVARLTRLYERAVRLNGMNNPDMYMAGSGGYEQGGSSGLRGGGARGGAGFMGGNATITMPAVVPAAPQPTDNAGPIIPATMPAVPAPVPVAPDADASPATAATAKKEEKKVEPKKEDSKPTTANGSSNNGDKPADVAPTKPQVSAKPAENTSTSAPAPTPSPAASQSAPKAVHEDDPDASPATAAHINRKKNKEKDKSKDVDENKKVAGDAED